MTLSAGIAHPFHASEKAERFYSTFWRFARGFQWRGLVPSNELK
jgi:hypothetical protein